MTVSRSQREQRGVDRMWAGWKEVSAGLVCWPDKSRDEPTTAQQEAKPSPAPGFHWLCCPSSMGRKHLHSEGGRAHSHLLIPGPEQQLGALNFSMEEDGMKIWLVHA